MNIKNLPNSMKFNWTSSLFKEEISKIREELLENFNSKLESIKDKYDESIEKFKKNKNGYIENFINASLFLKL